MLAMQGELLFAPFLNGRWSSEGRCSSTFFLRPFTFPTAGMVRRSEREKPTHALGTAAVRPAHAPNPVSRQSCQRLCGSARNLSCCRCVQVILHLAVFWPWVGGAGGQGWVGWGGKGRCRGRSGVGWTGVGWGRGGMGRDGTGRGCV